MFFIVIELRYIPIQILKEAYKVFNIKFSKQKKLNDQYYIIL